LEVQGDCHMCSEKSSTRAGPIKLQLVCVCPPYGPPAAFSPSPATDEPPTAATSLSTSLAAQPAADQPSAVPPAVDSLPAATWLDRRVRLAIASPGFAAAPSLRCKVCNSNKMGLAEIIVKLCLHVLPMIFYCDLHIESQQVPAHNLPVASTSH